MSRKSATPETSGQDNSGAAAASGSPVLSYHVLARKYRPQVFRDLIGQDAMVRTVANAFASGRIAQAYMLTGVRGVGKTTTARIIARALNYSLPGKVDQPTIDMEEPGEHCEAIMQSRHVDVIEMDAASHTGIDDIREIIDSVRYKPVSARYKVYIIDEVHMLSKQAFNGLLKTLEEPPEHVKFIFATTEIRKVPITVLSRCQRFDLRRIDAAVLAAHLKTIVGKENIAADDDALAMIAGAAEGSVRDALSILDQAIAHSGGKVEAAQIRDILGLADRGRVIELFRMVMEGDIAAALAEVREQYEAGAEPSVILSDLAQFIHYVTRVKYVPEAANDPALAQAEREAGARFASSLDLRALARAWQMILKGIEETKNASSPLAAAEMVLVRMAHAATLPTPDELIRQMTEADRGAGNGAGAEPGANMERGSAPAGPSAGGSAAPVSRAPAPAQQTVPDMPPAGPASAALAEPASVPRADAADMEPPVHIADLQAIVDLAERHREFRLKAALEEKVRLVGLEPGRLEIGLDEGAPPNLANELGSRLSEWTGRRWMIVVSSGVKAATISEQGRSESEARIRSAAADPDVRRLLDRFPGAEIVEVRDNPRGGERGEDE